MKTVNIHEAKTHLSRLVEDALAGEEIIVAKAGRPLVRLAPFVTPGRRRVLGQLKNRVTETASCWDPDPSMESLFLRNAVLPRPARRARPKRA
jgi:prevent-host-death family protein